MNKSYLLPVLAALFAVACNTPAGKNPDSSMTVADYFAGQRVRR